MRMCLNRCSSVAGNVFVVGRKRRLARGLRLVATDMSWSKASSPEVHETAEALLMAIAGRSIACGDLTGSGLTMLSAHYRTDSTM